MSQNKTIAMVVLASGAAYILFRRNPVTGQSVADSLLLGPGQNLNLPTKAPGNASVLGPGTPSSKGSLVIGAIGAGSAAVGSLFAAGGATAATGAAAAAAGGGAGTAGGVAGGIGVGATVAWTAGIAGAVVLTWAVWKKGLFRGGEEALLVNPDRDQFLAQFGPRWQGAGKGGPAWEESGNGRLAALLTEVTHEPNGSHYWTALAQADHVDPFVAACRDIQRVLAGAGIKIQSPSDGGAM